jgi:serine/threonine protein kinase
MKVAIKKVPNAFDDLVDAKRILREIKLLRYFDHENIISLTDVPKPEERIGYNDIYIVTDLMETDLHRVIYSRQELSDDHIQYFLYQILRGVLYMHSAHIVHRDLKPSNILANKNCDLKICDLGLGRGNIKDDENEKACPDNLTEYIIYYIGMLLLDGIELLRLYYVQASILKLLIYGLLDVFSQSY